MSKESQALGMTKERVALPWRTVAGSKAKKSFLIFGGGPMVA
jgi:hypothetical protein